MTLLKRKQDFLFLYYELPETFQLHGSFSFYCVVLEVLQFAVTGNQVCSTCNKEVVGTEQGFLGFGLVLCLFKTMVVNIEQNCCS